jgi:hypothetical protein
LLTLKFLSEAEGQECIAKNSLRNYQRQKAITVGIAAYNISAGGRNEIVLSTYFKAKKPKFSLQKYKTS